MHFPGDFNSGVWKRHTQLLEKRLDDLRAQNDSLAADPIKTAAIRGRIDEVKRMLALPTSGSASTEAPPHFDARGYDAE